MLKVIPLGGLGEVGLNMMVLEYEDNIIIIDAGLMFPEDYMLGIDFVIPDFKYLKERKDIIKAIILTHGHEDHIGAMPFFLMEFSVPVFATSFTLALLKEKIKEHKIANLPHFQKIKPGDITDLGPFKIEYISVNHSIVDGVALAVKTPEGVIIHSGDFKIDPTPIDNQYTDLDRFADFGEKGVLCLFSDSTNAEKEGSTISEKEIQKTIETYFQSSQGRIIIASFASNISRIQLVVTLAHKYKRKVLFNGKSMITNVNLAKKEGFIKIDEGMEIMEHQINQFPDHQITIITTGSQGEPMSALTRIAHGNHKSIKIRKGDTIILSSRFIPGNEKAITSLINNLYRMGGEVIYEKISDIHTSGHAKRDELKILFNLVKPRFFIPIHGEYRHLINHVRLITEMNFPENRVMIAENSDIICFKNQDMWREGTADTGRVMVDGKGIGDVRGIVLGDRQRLSEHGMVIVFLSLDTQSGNIAYGPDIISRGFVFEDIGQFILEDAKCLILEILDEMEVPLSLELLALKTNIQKRLKRFFYNVIQRSPLILPIIIPVQENQQSLR